MTGFCIGFRYAKRVASACVFALPAQRWSCSVVPFRVVCTIRRSSRFITYSEIVLISLRVVQKGNYQIRHCFQMKNRLYLSQAAHSYPHPYTPSLSSWMTGSLLSFNPSIFRIWQWKTSNDLGSCVAVGLQRSLTQPCTISTPYSREHRGVFTGT